MVSGRAVSAEAAGQCPTSGCVGDTVTDWHEQDLGNETRPRTINERLDNENQSRRDTLTDTSATQRATMKAIVQDRYGPPDVLHLEDVEEPTPADDEVVVRVIAASAFIGDWHIATGLPYAIRAVSGLRAPKPRVRGQDFAGRIEAV